MLKDLNIISLKPTGIMALLASCYDVEADTMFEHYATGVYRHDGFSFNFDKFLEDNCHNNILDEWVWYGVCDNYKQILEYHKELLSNPDKNYVIGLTTVERCKQPDEGGWRWHKWGEYIGTQTPQHEYLYDDTHIDKVYCYHIYEIE